MSSGHFSRRGSASPLISTNDVSVRNNRTDKYKNQSVKWLIFSFAKIHPKTIMKGWCKNEDN